MEAVKCQDREVIRVLLACSAVDINAASERTHSDPSSNFPIIWCLRNKKYQIAMDIYNIYTNIQILTIFIQLPGSDKDKWTSMERLLCPEGCNNTPCVVNPRHNGVSEMVIIQVNSRRMRNFCYFIFHPDYSGQGADSSLLCDTSSDIIFGCLFCRFFYSFILLF